MEILGALIAGTFIGSVLGFVGAGGAMLAHVGFLIGILLVIWDLYIAKK
mgnify:CR=1 FL=1